MSTKITGAVAKNSALLLNNSENAVAKVDNETTQLTAALVHPAGGGGAGLSKKESVAQKSTEKKQSINATIEDASANENLFFFEDEVYHIDRRGRVKFGVITDTCDLCTDDSEDDEPEEKLSKTEIRVAYYPDGKEVKQNEDEIGLADRTLLPGDVVRRMIPGKRRTTGQCGYVREIYMTVDVRILGTKYVIKNVPCERLTQISEWGRDSAVSLGQWVGTTTSVEEKAVLRSPTGTLVEIGSNDYYKFKDMHSSNCRDIFHPNVFYEGNIVIGRLPALERVKVLTPDVVLPTNKKGRHVVNKYHVESVRTESITVQWQYRANSPISKLSESEAGNQPDEVLKGEQLRDLKRLNLFESCMLQINDRAYLKYSKCDKIIKFSDWENEKAAWFRTKRAQLIKTQKGNNSSNLETNCSSDSSSNNKKSALNEMNSRSSLQQSKSNDSMDTINSNEQQARSEEEDQDLSIEEIDDNDDSTVPPARGLTRTNKRRNVKKKPRTTKRHWNILSLKKKDTDPQEGDTLVVETIYVHSYITVAWQNGKTESNISSTELYPIHHLDNHEFFPGDFICSNLDNQANTTHEYGVIQNVDYYGRTALVKWYKAYTDLTKPIPTYIGTKECSVYDIRDNPDFQYRPGTMVVRIASATGADENSTAGQVIDNFTDGRLKIWWVNGHITICYPQDVFEIAQNDQDAEDDDYDDVSEGSWETESEKSNIGSDISDASIGDEFLLDGVARAKDAINNLEKIFNLVKTQKQTDDLPEFMDLLKDCRYFDHLIHKNFFDATYFQGLVRVKKREKYSEMLSSCGPDISNENDIEMKEELKTENTQENNDDKQENSKSEMKEEQFDMEVDTPLTNSNEIQKADQKVLPPDTHKFTCDIRPKGIRVKESKRDLKSSNVPLTDEEQIRKYKKEYDEILKTSKIIIHMAFNNRLRSKKHDSGNSTNTDTANETGTTTSIATIDENSATCKDAATEIDELVKKQKLNLSFSQLEELKKPPSIDSLELTENYKADIYDAFLFLFGEQIEKCREWIEQMSARLKDRIGKEIVEHDEDVISVSSGADSEVICSECALNNINPTASSSPSENPSTDIPAAAAKDEEIKKPQLYFAGISPNCFEMLSKAPSSHKFIATIICPSNRSQYTRAIHKEYKLLQTSLPAGVRVRAFEDRMDLLTVMMEGPRKTPYEDALFFFDFQMPRDYPKSPPTCHYISFCTDRLNPNLYEEGKVCVSLLGTWSGRDTEVWSPGSTLLQVLVSIQGLILVDEPYFNEAGYEKQRGSQRGIENSRMYNEMAIIKVVQSTNKQIISPPEVFVTEVYEFYGDKRHALKMYERITKWVSYSKDESCKPTEGNDDFPSFPLLPCSRGCCLALENNLQALQSRIKDLRDDKFKTVRIPAGSTPHDTIAAKNTDDSADTPAADPIDNIEPDQAQQAVTSVVKSNVGKSAENGEKPVPEADLLCDEDDSAHQDSSNNDILAIVARYRAENQLFAPEIMDAENDISASPKAKKKMYDNNDQMNGMDISTNECPTTSNLTQTTNLEHDVPKNSDNESL